MSDSEPSSPRQPASAEDATSASSSTAKPQRRKRQRVRLSCLECRRRKLSCDRGFPCDRCVKSGTADACSYEGPAGAVAHNTSAGVPAGFAQLDPRSDGDAAGGAGAGAVAGREQQERIRRLEADLKELKALLGRQGGVLAQTAAGSLEGSTLGETDSPGTQREDVSTAPEKLDELGPGDEICHRPGPPSREGRGGCPENVIEGCHGEVGVVGNELRFFRGKEFKTRYYGPCNATMAFLDLTGLCPYMKANTEAMFRPGMCDRKDRMQRKVDRDAKFAERDLQLELLLPPKELADELVSIYLDQFEQIHRVVHIPTFKREYAQFWAACAPSRYAALTALILGIISVSSSLYSTEPISQGGYVTRSHQAAGRWIAAVEDWSSQQSMKHRRLIHYQISCLLFLAKRVNTIKKKRFWTAAGSLVNDGISVGLHKEPAMVGHARISVFNQEMRRRIWATVQELDMQASFDHGLPTILSQLHIDTREPLNIDDDEFDESTTELPPSRPVKEYTFSSYQHIARQSLPLRLELSRMLCGPGQPDYDLVVKHTTDLSQEIDSLPSWDCTGENARQPKKPLLAYTLLHVQLRQYLVLLHQPFLKLRKANPRYQYSELIYYNATRDIVLLHDKLYGQGIRVLNFLRDDSLTSAMNLCSVTLLQPRGSTNMISINSPHTIKLLEKCLDMKTDRLLRCGNPEPWGFSIMSATLGLLEEHLGLKTQEQAKEESVKRFQGLQKRLFPGHGAQAPGGVVPAVMNVMDTTKTAVPFGHDQMMMEGLPTSWLPDTGEAQMPGQQLSLEDALGVNFNQLFNEQLYYI